MPRGADLLADARRRLAAAPFAPSPREAMLLLAVASGRSEAQVLARTDEEVPPGAAARFAELLERRLRGEPYAYLVGEREFYGRPFFVDRRVLIPRPETEHSVEAVLALPLPAAPRLLDIGTGSGALAVTLALERPRAWVAATDLSPAALAVAARNRNRHAARVAFVAGNLAAGLSLAGFDVVVSNPPYIARHDAAALSPEVRDYEPATALFAEGNGDTILRQLLALGAAGLRPGAFLVLEIGLGQLEPLARDLPRALRLREARSDYAGIPRVLVVEKTNDG
ncbi:MAG: peptide chain release factor N(5)-glutamine methyltransferase [Acidobacteriota bacterium]